MLALISRDLSSCFQQSSNIFGGVARFRKLSRSIGGAVLLFSNLILYSTYYAGFRSNILSVAEEYTMNSEDLRTDLIHGELVLLVQSYSFLKTPDRMILFGTKEIENDSRVAIVKVSHCSFLL